MMKGKVFIFSAPSGAGKSTVVNYLLGQYPQQFEFSVSATSRAPRGEEKDGVEYYFISAERFRELIAQDAFVEYEEVYEDRFYGTLKSEVDRIWKEGKIIIFDVDVKGGVSLKKYFGNSARSVLIVPPSMEILEQRLRGRGTDSEEAITERLAKARWELDFASGKFDRELVNDRLDNTFALARDIVDAFLNQ
jgi:guanylate kinase